jgi:hypothetical protein
MRSLMLVALLVLFLSGAANAGEFGMVVGKPVALAPEQTPVAAVILRGSVPVNVSAPPAAPSQREVPASPDLSSSSGAIGWDRTGLGPQ